jgi:3-methyladenine DNA glycosylase AlkD
MASIVTVRAKAVAAAKKHRAEPHTLATAAKDEQLAFEMFRASKAAVLTLTPVEIESLLAHLHDWNSTDCFGSFVSGVAWREGVLSDTKIKAWTRSEMRWTRRAALVSTVPLNQNARGSKAPKGEAVKTLSVCAMLVDDRDDMVVKAMSWALRVLAAKDGPAVVDFLERHKDRLAPRVVRETRNKLSTGLKNPKVAQS